MSFKFSNDDETVVQGVIDGKQLSLSIDDEMVKEFLQKGGVIQPRYTKQESDKIKDDKKKAQDEKSEVLQSSDKIEGVDFSKEFTLDMVKEVLKDQQKLIRYLLKKIDK